MSFFLKSFVLIFCIFDMKISQQQFNEDVKTTMDDFEVPLEEAINMTIEEYQIQGIILNCFYYERI